MSTLDDENLGVISLTFFQLMQGNDALPLGNKDKLAHALFELALRNRLGKLEHTAGESAEIAEAIRRGLVTDKEDGIQFTNRQIGGLAETWGVIEYLQPDYVDRARMYDQAIEHLVSIGASAVPLLVELLGHRESSVSNGASFALGMIGKEAIPAVQWAILFGNARVRANALKSLSTMKKTVPLTDGLLNLVSTVLAEDGHAMVKVAAVVVLSDSKNPIAVEALRRTLDDQHLNPSTKSLVLDALQRLDIPEARRAIDDSKRGTTQNTSITPQGGWQIEAPFAKEAPVRVPRVFISYAKEDVEVMEEYGRRLKLSGFDVWADSQHLVAGDRWDERLRFAIGSSDFVVALLSKFTWDGYQCIELEQALIHQKKREVPFLLPVYLSLKESNLKPANFPSDLQDIQIIVAQGFSSGWTQIYSSLSEATQMLGLHLPKRLRSERRTDLTEAVVWRTVFDKDFFSLSRNPDGRPLGREWELVLNETLAYDRATGLTWTRSPVVKECNLMQALAVPALYKEKFKIASSLHFRLPTLEEAMGLMTLETTEEGCHRTRFMRGSNYMMTCDTMPAPPGLEGVSLMVWFADFLSTDVIPVPIESPGPVWLVASD